jgi:muramoyltetrapeptide carboxypeptidase
MPNIQSIGIIALSSSCEEERFLKGVDFLKAQGLSVRVMLEPCLNYGKSAHLFSSDSARKRAEALAELFSDSSIDAILAARGAYGSMEILPHFDFSLAIKHPKPVVGFSDTTAILLALYQKGRLPVVHGPSVESAFSKANEEPLALKSAMALLDYLRGDASSMACRGQFRRLSGDVDSAGPLIGGNLCLLSALMGTPWEPDLTGHVLFLEEVGERPYRVHRMLLQLKLAGKLGRLRGVVLGQFNNCEHADAQTPDLADVFRDIFSAYQYPVLGMVPAGHGLLNLPVPFGISVTISGDKLELV